MLLGSPLPHRTQRVRISAFVFYEARLLAAVQAGGGERGEAGLVAAYQGGLEEHLGALEALLADADELAIWELVVHAQVLQAQAELLLGLEGRVAALLLDVLDHLQYVAPDGFLLEKGLPQAPATWLRTCCCPWPSWKGPGATREAP